MNVLAAFERAGFMGKQARGLGNEHSEGEGRLGLVTFQDLPGCRCVGRHPQVLPSTWAFSFTVHTALSL